MSNHHKNDKFSRPYVRLIAVNNKPAQKVGRAPRLTLVLPKPKPDQLRLK